MAVEVETPEDYAGNVMGDLSSRRGMVQGMEDMVGGGKAIKAEVPLSEMFGYSTTLRSATQGRATYSMEFKHYAEAPRNVAEAIVAARAKESARPLRARRRSGFPGLPATPPPGADALSAAKGWPFFCLRRRASGWPAARGGQCRKRKTHTGIVLY